MAGVLLLVGSVGAVVVMTRAGHPSPQAAAPAAAPVPTTTEQPSTATPSATCRYLPNSDVPAGLSPAMTPPPHPSLPDVPHVVLTTNQGVIKVDLATAAAPCTVNSFLSLAHNGFYNRTPCHRLTTDAIFVLQCGDPSGAGQGGPGYKFGDENLPTLMKPAYPRGTLAMANSGPGTNGSQFFLVYNDSDIDPNYSIFGTVTEGIEVLDKIAANGTDDSNGPHDGKPNLDVTITTVK
jgi:peptidyl-prolyl cis-trans isomerase B (cyclophilin B)